MSLLLVGWGAVIETWLEKVKQRTSANRPVYVFDDRCRLTRPTLCNSGPSMGMRIRRVCGRCFSWGGVVALESGTCTTYSRAVVYVDTTLSAAKLPC